MCIMYVEASFKPNSQSIVPSESSVFALRMLWNPDLQTILIVIFHRPYMAIQYIANKLPQGIPSGNLT